MKLSVKNMAGDQTDEIELSEFVFGAPVNTPLMHQALVRQQANSRQGTHKTKTRTEVAGGGRKPWRQKGTGRARQGSIRAPQWVGGGTVFGPRPRKYAQKMPKKMHRAALRSALSVKAGAEQLVVLDQLSIEVPRTKTVVEMLAALGTDSGSVLLVLPEANDTVRRSANNLKQVSTILSENLNVRDVLGHDTLLMVREAVEYVELWLGADEPLYETAPIAATKGELDTAGMAAEAVPVMAGVEPSGTDAANVEADVEADVESDMADVDSVDEAGADDETEG